MSIVAGAVAKGVSADLRVVGKGGKVLTEQTLSTGTTTIKTSPKANCFGAGTAGSGKSVTVRGATALGLLGQASKSTTSLRPLLVTDAFDFGLGICGVGTSKVSGKASWYLKVNHKGATVSGDAVKLKPGDEVLWDLAPSYPYPNELALEAPERRRPGSRSRSGSSPTTKKASASRSPERRSPGRSAPTDADGSATVTLSEASRSTKPCTRPTARTSRRRRWPAVCVGGTAAATTE